MFQSLPTNEIGWHAASKEGNRTSIGIEICMNPEMDVDAGYRRAALLTAVMAQQLGISVANGIVQHHFWSGKNCPRVLRAKPNGWSDFLDQVRGFRKDLESVEAPKIAFMHLHDDDA